MSFKVVGIGEVLWDLLPSGPQLGGAPANFAWHARQLGADARVISRVGKDQDGRKILRRFGELGLPAADLPVDESAPTGTVAVTVAPDGSPEYHIHENVAWDCLTATPEALAIVREADAVCFGTLAQRSVKSRNSIQRMVSATSARAWRVFDVNFRQRYFDRVVIEQSLEIANALKLNDQELAALTPMFGLSGDSRQKIEQLVRRFNLQLVALTRAECGSLLYHSANWSELPGCQSFVVDTVGAGDAFTAALVLGLLHQLALEDLHRIAAEIAGFVCSRPGATPKLPRKLHSAFHAGCTTAGT